MNCPYCAGAMDTKHLTGRLGKKITIKKCKDCDGFWLKGFDLFDMSLEDCKALDDSIFHHNNYKKEVNCPKCNLKLKSLTHYNLPKDLQFKYCESCAGVWAYPGKILEFKQRDIHNREKAASIPARTKMVLTLTFVFIFGVFSWVNLQALSGGAIFSAYDGSASLDGLTKTNLNLAIEGIIVLLVIGTLMILWGKYRKIGWVLNFAALFVIIFYVMLKLISLYNLSIIK